MYILWGPLNGQKELGSRPCAAGVFPAEVSQKQITYCIRVNVNFDPVNNEIVVVHSTGQKNDYKRIARALKKTYIQFQ